MIRVCVAATFLVLAICTLLVLMTPKPDRVQFHSGQAQSSVVSTDVTSVEYWQNYKTSYTATYESDGELEVEGLQCPIPPQDRVPNYTGIQCVWSSIEMLGRWAEEPKLVNPPLTSRNTCKSLSNPDLVNHILTSLNVKFEQSFRNRSAGLAMIRKAMKEGRGCAFGVPGHMMTLVHFDEQTDIVRWVDNSDSTLKVQKMTVSRFLSVWDTWVVVIYADKDIIPFKVNPAARQIDIIDRNNPQGTYPPNYIPLPNNR